MFSAIATIVFVGVYFANNALEQSSEKSLSNREAEKIFAPCTGTLIVRNSRGETVLTASFIGNQKSKEDCSGAFSSWVAGETKGYNNTYVVEASYTFNPKA